MCMIFFGVCPAITFYVERYFSFKVYNLWSQLRDDKEVEESILKNSKQFLLLKVIFSSGFSLACTKIIEFYYSKKTFRTFSGLDWSFYNFYNFYYLLNQIVADFYGIISLGITEFSSKKKLSKDKNILLSYYNYIFVAALKVCLILIIIPFVLKIRAFLPKLLHKIRVKFGLFKPLNIDRVRGELPVRHNLPEMASFVS